MAVVAVVGGATRGHRSVRVVPVDVMRVVVQGVTSVVLLVLPVSMLVVLMVRMGVAFLLRVVAVWRAAITAAAAAAASLVRRDVVQILLSVVPRICPQFWGGHRPHTQCFRPQRLLRLRLRLWLRLRLVGGEGRRRR